MADKVHKSDYATPIPERTAPTDWIRTIQFSILFNFLIISTNISQFVFFFLFYPFEVTRPYYERCISYSKSVFSRLIVSISQLFAPTKFVISCSDEEGNYLDPERLVKRNAKGRVIEFNLPERSIWIANHQVYTDWLYLWSLAYYANLSDAIFIILRSGFEWIPFLGWGMQFFRFIFLKRAWNKDKKTLATHLAFMASLGQDPSTSPSPGSAAPISAIRGVKNKILLLIFPEGTLVSKLTRPKSQEYADKLGIPPCTNLLLPRSTGLLFCLRSLAADVSDLKLVDFTIGYPGIPPAGYGQSHYTLRSTFMQGNSPPSVHMHFTILSIKKDSDSSSASPPLGKLPKNAASAAQDDHESTEEERKTFDDWLLKRWRQKDEQMNQFYKNGDFVEGEYKNGTKNSSRYLEIPIELKSVKDFADMFLWGAPIVVLYLLYKLIRW